MGALGVVAGAILLLLAPHARADADGHASVTLFTPEREPAWSPLDDDPPAHLALLVHGLDEPGSIWDELAPAIHDHGRAVARFEYPNDQPARASGTMLQQTLAALRDAGVERIDVVAHSMGGLVARDALTRDPETSADDGARAIVARLVTVGTPNAGSPWARARIVGEIREHAARLAEGEGFIGTDGTPAFAADGRGQAGRDLLPDSAYLADLNARPLPDLPITVIIGRLGPRDPRWATDLADEPWLRAIVGDDNLDRALHELATASDEIGDGVVTVESAQLPGAADVVHVEASHRGMLRTMQIEQTARRVAGEPVHDTPPAIPVILDRLGLAPLPDETTDPATPKDTGPP